MRCNKRKATLAGKTKGDIKKEHVLKGRNESLMAKQPLKSMNAVPCCWVDDGGGDAAVKRAHISHQGAYRSHRLVSGVHAASSTLVLLDGSLEGLARSATPRLDIGCPQLQSLLM